MTHLKAVLTTLKGKVRFLLGTDYATYMWVSKGSSLFWQSVSQRIEEHKTHVSPTATCQFEIYSEETIVQSVQG